MHRELKETTGYSKVIFTLSALTLVFGILYGIAGELFLPFAISALALLFIYENPNLRIFSYIVPIITLIPSVLSYGVYGLISAQYIIYAIILSVCYVKLISKNECSVYLTLAISIFLTIYLYLLGAREISDFSAEAVSDYYSTIFTNLKNTIVEYLSSYSMTLEDGRVESPFNSSDINEAVMAYSKLAVAVLGIISFAIAGISIKIFVAIANKYSKKGVYFGFATDFMPSTIVTIVYIVTYVLSILINAEDILGIAIVNISAILSVVFAYVGFKYVRTLGKMTSRRGFYNSMLVAGFLIIPTAAIQILSLVGAWFAIGANKYLQDKNSRE